MSTTIPSYVLYALLATISISALSLVAGSVLIYKKAISRKAISFFVAIAAGVMLTATFFDVLPEAMEQASAQSVLIAVFTGIVLSFVLERSILWHHHHEDTHHVHPSALLISVGDGLHNFIDGVAIAAAFIASPHVGVATTIAIAAHELPQEIADFSILVYAGLSQKKALLVNFISALAAVVGTLVGLYFMTTVSWLLPYVLGFTGGAFIYIACADLIPDLHANIESRSSINPLIPFLTGCLLMGLIIYITNEFHGSENQKFDDGTAQQETQS